ncbi:hypothetical protein HYV43_06580 [Candidatus Micrarchaeota archaeon]|nr:hypothetical protein [Candidatus Micrarchaeota archaeon]
MRALVVLLLFSPVLLAISSSEALEALGTCLQENNPQLQPLGQTFLMEDTPHYVFYYPLSNARRMVAAVNQEDGELVRDPARLARMGTGLYNDLLFREQIKAKGFSADTMTAATQAGQDILEDQYAKLQVFQTQTTAKYPQLSFQQLESRLDALRSKSDVLLLQLSNTVSEEQLHLDAPSSEGAAAVIQQYNASFTALFDYLAAYDDYSKAITNAERQLYEQSIPDPDNKNINTNLENLRDIGISSLYAKAKTTDPRKNLATLISQRPQWVNDSVSSFFFQDLSCRANAAYDEALPQYRQVVQSEALLRSAGLERDVREIKSDWAEIVDARDKRTAENYQFVLDNLPTVKAEMVDLKARYDRLIAPTSTPKPKTEDDPTNWLILVIVLALGAYGFWMYRKKQQEESGEESGDSHGH